MATIEERAEKWAKEYVDSDRYQPPLYYQETINALITAYLAGSAQTQKDCQ